MTSKESMTLLVGDNPFHGISHLSQERSRARNAAVKQSEFAAGLVMSALDNGADGFMFSVSETTLSILHDMRKNGRFCDSKLYAIVPYAYEYVRLAAQVGGVPGLGRRIGKQILLSMNGKAIVAGVRGLVSMDPEALMKTYLFYEISRLKSAAGRKALIDSVLLHEIITEMALAFNLDWFIKSYIEFLKKQKIKPGFETRNFALLAKKFKSWGINFNEVVIVSAFNKAGFQMNPSKEECERALLDASGGNVIAMSMLASGYLRLPEAANYIKTLPNLSGVVVGVSKEQHAKDTFNFLKERLGP